MLASGAASGQHIYAVHRAVRNEEALPHRVVNNVPPVRLARGRIYAANGIVANERGLRRIQQRARFDCQRQTCRMGKRSTRCLRGNSATVCPGDTEKGRVGFVTTLLGKLERVISTASEKPFSEVTESETAGLVSPCFTLRELTDKASKKSGCKGGGWTPLPPPPPPHPLQNAADETNDNTIAGNLRTPPHMADC